MLSHISHELASCNVADENRITEISRIFVLKHRNNGSLVSPLENHMPNLGVHGFSTGSRRRV